MEQLDSDAAWETKMKGEDSELWLEFVEFMDPEREMW
jgi:hypothetical protein